MSILSYIKGLEDDTNLTRVLRYLKTRSDDYYTASIEEIIQTTGIKKNLLQVYVYNLPFFKTPTFGSVKLVMKISKVSVTEIKDNFSQCNTKKELLYTYFNQYSVKDRYKTFTRFTIDVQSMNGLKISNDTYNVVKKYYKSYSAYF